jgi:hypothetical protein
VDIVRHPTLPAPIPWLVCAFSILVALIELATTLLIRIPLPFKHLDAEAAVPAPSRLISRMIGSTFAACLPQALPAFPRRDFGYLPVQQMAAEVLAHYRAQGKPIKVCVTSGFRA